MKKSKSSASDPFTTALRVLTRRDHSEAELRHKLEQFGFCAKVIDEAMVKCRDYNYLNDERYALQRARSLAQSGRGVGRKILLDLRQRGIDANLAQLAVDRISEENPPADVLAELLERRFPNFDYASASDKERRRVVGFLQRRGFSLEEIFATLKNEAL